MNHRKNKKRIGSLILPTAEIRSVFAGNQKTFFTTQPPVYLGHKNKDGVNGRVIKYRNISCLDKPF